MQERIVGIPRAGPRCGAPGPRSPLPALPSRSGTLARQGSPQERETDSASPKPLLVCVFLKRCMLTHTPLFIPPSASSSFFSLLFSRSPRAVAFVSGFRISPSFLSTCNLVTPVLRNSPPLPEGQRNKNRHKMSCERSSWKVFLQKIRGTNEGLPLGTRTFSHLQSILKPKKTDH